MPGWNPDFAARAGDALLAGFTVFDEEDAREPGRRLLASGPLNGSAAQAPQTDSAQPTPVGHD